MAARADLIELGRTGLNRQGGVVYEEWLRELQGERWRRVIKEMTDQDPVIGAILYAIEMLVRQVSWRVEAASDAAEDQAAGDFVRECLGDMSYSWTDTLAEILTMLPWGWANLETVYKIRGGDSRDGRRKSKYSDGRLAWRKWSIRAQETLSEWQFDEEGGITGMWQIAPPDYDLVFIPIEKSLLFRTTTRKGNPEGRSILRNAYEPWYYSRNLRRIEAIGVERDLAGLPVAHVPPELLSSNATADQVAILAAITQIVTNIRRDEQEGVVWPLQYDDKGNPLYKLELLSSGGQRQFDTDKIIQRYDGRMAMSVLADFILIGHESVGSFALTRSKTNLFTVALGAFLDIIAGITADGQPTGVVNTYAIPRLLRLNGMIPAGRGMPMLVHDDVEPVDLAALGEYISKLAGAGFVLPSIEGLQEHLLQQAYLPAAGPSKGRSGEKGKQGDKEQEEG